MRPLDFLPVHKAKLGVVIVAAVVATTAILAFGDELGSRRGCAWSSRSSSASRSSRPSRAG